VIDQLRAVRNELAPSVPLAILSNSSTLGTPSVVKALAKLDERYMKLDAGEPALMRRINATTVPFEQIVDGLGRLQDIVIQTMFVRDRLGRIDNTGDVSVATWINVLLRRGRAPSCC
jgi:wyosine [tRNA(Phe)-imidazoG37] synthetase (radical SAM superfamily)